ncbi:flagellar basal-body rod protein FlgB [Caloramator quimbayensis]|uniref:Flagellar basal body rod protein FlgB n=1 Tax=Caloramator quimbayensis TaxID=1147123 RepID=A0A1T4X9M6_9CLOT|nr:flagellar basal body rod protein FlgB [Caloramator quimbayensis]SKA86312.1 flagellar basal-body rod protein FlgB [Caloramator quimbayensis]
MVGKIDEITYNLIKKSIDASSSRGKVIANNIANVNTKGFKASYVVFEDKLKNILENKGIDLKTTNERHISSGNSINNINYEIKKNTASSMRLDGNNVDIDSEMVSLAENTILYNALISQTNSRIAMRRLVTNGGK